MSGEEHHVVSELVAKNIIPTLIALINRHYEKKLRNEIDNELKVVDQAIWCLGNIAGDRPEYMKQIVSSNIGLTISNILNNHT